MTIDALKNFAQNTWETVGHTGKSWIKDSPMIYAATAASYYGTLYGSLYGVQWLKGLEAAPAAKFTFTALSAMSAIRSLLNQGSAIDLRALKPNPIIVSNGIAISLAVASYLKIQVPVLPAIAVTSITGIAAWMFGPESGAKQPEQETK